MLPNIREVKKESESQPLGSPQQEVVPEPQVVLIEHEENQEEIEKAEEPKLEEVPEVKVTIPEPILPQVQYNEYENKLFDEIN